MGNLQEDLVQCACTLNKYSDFYVEVDARIGELGRQLYTARKFMINIRIAFFFGTDVLRKPKLSVYCRFLETDDECVDPAEG